MRILGIIPARYASTRFPGKPLTMINGKTMIQRVYEQSLKADLLADVIVATDDQRIFDAVMKFGGKVMMTSSAVSAALESGSVITAISSGNSCQGSSRTPPSKLMWSRLRSML